MERSQGMASGNTGFQVEKSIKFIVNCSFAKLPPLLEGDLNPILGFCFPLLQGGIGSRSRAARDERLGVPWAAEDQFKKRIKLSECSLWTLRRN